MSPQMAASSTSTSTIWWIWTLWQSRPRSPPPQTSAQPSVPGESKCVCVSVFVSVCVYIEHLSPSLCPWRESLMMSSSAGICWNQILCSAVSTLATMDVKHQIQLIATSLIKSGEDVKQWEQIRRLIANQIIEFNESPSELTLNLLLGLFPLWIMWMSWATPTCGFRLWEDSIFPKILQRFVLRSSFIWDEHIFCCLWPHHVALVFQGVRVGSSLSASQMESTMKLLRGRVQSRLALHKQFASLGRSHFNDYTLNTP